LSRGLRRRGGRVVLEEMSPAVAGGDGEARIEGDLVAFMRMNMMFEQGV